ncbi:APC membrane recruitment protein 1 [Scyliorhinus canicula]|uniref:APC membrane recruitment protein 1 n=1 Tax=Scyliorhinus canicula TaxID=7830 RepID=UPI0018F5F2AD|nr:APC membrane recruitment protein 1 [Scyliorhinus canicula]
MHLCIGTVAMETDSKEETAGTKALSAGRGELARGNQAQGAAVRAPSECTDATDAEQSSGKLKKTAFKLFGGRKNICTLPSFFTIKNKGQVKGPSKKGIAKSKTHSGISEVVLDINQKEGSDTGWSGYTDSSSCNSAAARSLCGSKSEHSVLDINVNSDFYKVESLRSENSECFSQKQSTDKTSSVRRSKKGLRGLFNSIRRHKKNKAVDSAKGDPLDSNHAAADFAHTEQMTAGEEGVRADVKKGLVELNLKPSYKMNHSGTGDFIDKIGTVNSTSSLSESCATKTEKTLKNKRNDFETSGAEVRKVSPVEIKTLNGKTGAAVLKMDSSFGSMPDIVKPNCIDHDPPSVHSFDQISLIFGDVTSLKSFDSLTGCGDITADHDDDSIAESMVSGERGRTAGKRSSCLVTYQGGGEEMATPDEVDDEYLKALWDKATGAVTLYDSSQNIAEDGGECPRSPSDVEHSALHINLADPCVLRSITDSAINSSELVTPQSDHQESAPNSDEGYYDSTTPGHDEEGADSISQSQNERLPRDSYSGDALYELLVEQNDSLMNSPPSEKQSLETKSPFRTSFTSILNFSVQEDINVSCIPSKQSVLLTSGEEKFAFIREDKNQLAHMQQLTCWESDEKTALKKGLAFQERDMFFGDVRNTELSNTAAEAVSTVAKSQQAGLCIEPLVSHGLSRSGKVKDDYVPDRADEQNWTDLQESSCLKEANNKHIGSRPSVCGSYSVTKLHNKMPGAKCMQEYKSEKCNKWRQQMKDGENRGMKNLVLENTNVQGAVEDSCRNCFAYNRAEKTEEKCEQAINYSQALVEFTANRKLYPNLSNSLGSSDSSSQFTQDIHALPAMVTFDVVDVENEGECDQQSEMVTDEDISASCEAFDDSYMEKDLYHNCDDGMFHMCTQNSFHSNCWGVASLPRHVSLYKLSPSLPAPLSLNRRSRSLDTDSLESELIDLYVSKVTTASKSAPQSPDVLQYEQDGKKGSASHWFGKRTGQAVCLETQETAHISNRLGQQLAQYKQEPLSSDKRSTASKSLCLTDTNSGTQHTDMSILCKSNSVKLTAQNQSTAKRHLEPVINNKMPHNPRKLVRPSHLPLQNDSCVLQAGTVSFNSLRENTNGKQAYVSSSLNERQEVDFSKTSPMIQYSDSGSELDGKGYRAVGLSRALSPFCSKAESLKYAMDLTGLYTTANSSMFKGRSDLRVKLPVGWNKNTTTMDV